MGVEKDRLRECLKKANLDSICDIAAAAIRLQDALYLREDHRKSLFHLRKALEGIWGHELPHVDEHGEDRPLNEDEEE